MSNDSLGWERRPVRHNDGRTGVISQEFAGQRFVSLTIKVTDSAIAETVELHSTGADRGAKGWNWMCSRPGEPEEWVPLGRHNEA